MRFAEKIFNVFHRLHTAEEFPGTGVGLAIAQRVIHRHGGRIWAEGVPYESASFCFTLGSDLSSEGQSIN
jgi:light-regulated signal transduction histidine kinase (bacteriophytochrome)